MEVGRTDYTMVVPIKEKTCKCILEGFKIMRKELVGLGEKGIDVVRVHSDCDPSIVFPTTFSK